MSGNVEEWCLNEYENPERVRLSGEARRVVRGGSWRRQSGRRARVIPQHTTVQMNRDHDLGLRVVWSSPRRS